MTTGDIVGLTVILGGVAVSIIGIVQAIKSRFYSLSAPMFCIVAVLIVNIGRFITKSL